MNEKIIIETSWSSRVWSRYRESWFDRHIRFSFPVAVLVFATSVVTSFYAISYATESASNSVTDIILSNTPVFDVDGLMIGGTILLIATITFLLFHHPRRLAFGLYTLTLFFFIRSAFTSVTHIASYPLPPGAYNYSNTVGKFLFGFGGDLFFSAHTAIPFLMALLFWRRPLLRSMFLLWSAFFGVVVLLGHLHYTIDVFSAFFITYGIYRLALWLFPRDHVLFVSEGWEQVPKL